MAERRTHLRIDFVVQEVADDEGPTDDLRYIRFGDDVAMGHVRDFFERCTHAMALMFKQGTMVICLNNPGLAKINIIKIVRELGGYGLKEAKDIVESPPGVAVVACDDISSQEYSERLLREAGATIDVRSWRSSDFDLRPPLAPLAKFRSHT